MERDWKSSTINEIERLRDWNFLFRVSPGHGLLRLSGIAAIVASPQCRTGALHLQSKSTLSAAGCTRPSARLVVI